MIKNIYALLYKMAETYYITTAINYTNGDPHFGHAYEVTIADFLARYHRFTGKDVFFLTGTDEHGQKIADTAASKGLTPQELCDFYATKFKDLGQQLGTTPDFFVRTTSDQHKAYAQKVWKHAVEQGDIYLGQYEGWYLKREERFITETEASKMNYLDGVIPLVKTSEPSYFFRLSKYQNQLVQYIKDHQNFIFPKEMQADILIRLQEPLHDLSISRCTFDWGIPIPVDDSNRTDSNRTDSNRTDFNRTDFNRTDFNRTDFNRTDFNMNTNGSTNNHVMYVWFDALTNYLSGIDYYQIFGLQKFGGMEPPNFQKPYYWPPVHLIGKDIAWFHAVIWPCMLLSLNLELPKQIVCHGFINGPDGRKMSKSWGNVVDPFDILKKYSRDTIRYFLFREGAFGLDFNFSESSLKDRYHGELANNLGNLVQRGLNLSHVYCSGVIPEIKGDPLMNPIFDINILIENTNQAMKEYNLQNYVITIFEILTTINKWLTTEAPWNLKTPEQQKARPRIVRQLLESLYLVVHFLQPILPDISQEIFRRLGHSPVTLENLSIIAWRGLLPGTTIIVGDPLFPKLKV